MSNVILKVTKPYMEGETVKRWQSDVKAEFKTFDIDCPIVADGVYGLGTRSFTASLCHALGMNASEVMADGVTPELRIRIRNRGLTVHEKERFKDRVQWRRDLREKYESAGITNVHRITTKIITDSWGYHPGVHDGIDVNTPPNAILFAMVKSRIIDVRTGGWWGKAPSGDVSKGDGIVQMEILETVGPFIKGHHIGYGHAEHPFVKVGQIVDAGDRVARAGKAVTWHTHMMYNTGNTSKGIGNLDPRQILNYATTHG